MRTKRAGGIVCVLLGAAVAAAALPSCLDRPVTPATPQTSNVFVSAIRQDAIDKIDLLFVVDNSSSMADKQAILGDAVPELVNLLIDPPLVDGKQPFKPVRDIHIGVISSSLGGHGADQCSPAAGPNWNATMDDKAHLIGTLQSSSPERASVPAGYQNLGFLAWDPDNKYGGESDPAALIASFRQQVKAAGEQGCGYEATLEAWYRFLVDPNPPAEVVLENGQAVAKGTDEALLAQRRAFLRPDSLVAVIMLTDENDCSIVDGGIGWMSAQAAAGSGARFVLPRSTSACATDANSPCCQSCGTTAPNRDCAALPTLDAIQADSECQKGLHDTTSDSVNLRCWDQRRRFGIDFLYSTNRYVDALKSLKIRDRDGVEHDNPLFVTPGALTRDSGRVFLAGIVGVPWQDVATPDTLDTADTLDYQRAENIHWDWIVGDLGNNTKPLDPLMLEQPGPRSGVNPAKGYALAPVTSLNPQENPINGHEYVTTQDDLQYACIFPLQSPTPCTGDTSCDCHTSDLAANKPLCQPPSGGPAETNQYYAKAYPGLRHLQVLKDFGKNSIVASICPKVTDDTKPSYGYNPAVSAIVELLGKALPGECLPRKLVPEDDPASPDFEKVPCEVVEALLPQNGAACSCDAARGTSDLTSSDAALADAVRKQLAELGVCGGSTPIACSDFCLCNIEQLTGAALDACQAGKPTAPGYCYIDQEIADRNANDILVHCEETKKQVLSFVGGNVPANGSVAFIACAGATVGGT